MNPLYLDVPDDITEEVRQQLWADQEGLGINEGDLMVHHINEMLGEERQLRLEE